MRMVPLVFVMADQFSFDPAAGAVMRATPACLGDN
jgi:hypothetical protein